MPGELHFIAGSKGGDLAGCGEAADVRNVVADVVDLPSFDQRLPFVIRGTGIPRVARSAAA